jgi:DNA polymerase III epsilon subunit family exonuclease
MQPQKPAVERIPLTEVTFAFVDTETTGLAPQNGGRVCEVAVVLTRGDKQVETFSQLINPAMPIPPHISAIHGITDDMVRDQPIFAQVAPRLLSLLSGAAVVCHNADFDVSFLSWEFQQAGLRFPPSVILDTLRLARKHGGFKSNRLGNIVAELGISSEGWHRALSDAMMTEKVFRHFVDKFSSEGELTLADLVEYQTKALRRKQ